ncbi:MAG: hypothetical protein OXR82_12360 [Gammaproteobacteria bacterium]|nr:hypothetical protein [Gammaproteobacteria bacterium]MDE0259163.1 hypothetical protein [Gammaproteobacteria bacterium]
MSIAFVVMQIGDSELNQLFDTVIQPAIESVGLQAKRVDRHNEGGLLKSEIIEFLNNSDIIIADLTNERPNVYLEVGYAMGIDKFRNLILTCRSDHLPGNAGWQPDGPKIHFDLVGYDILLWEPSEPDSFRQELKRRIRRRRALLSPVTQVQEPVLDMDWVRTHQETASRQMAETGFTAYMEASFGIAAPKPDRSPSELLSAASDAMIRTFGWPIGVVFHDVPEYQPRPRSDGIVAEVKRAGEFPDSYYDYWALRRNGDFFLRKSLFEDKRDPTAIFFNTRIVRNTELLMYALRLYDRLAIDPSTRFELELRYGGLNGRVLRTSSPNRYMSGSHTCSEDQITTSYNGSLQDVEGSLTEVVKQLTAPMLALFDFFELADSIYQEIVEAYVEGRVT